MKKELRRCLCGTLAGLILGVLLTVATQHRQRNEQLTQPRNIVAKRREKSPVASPAPIQLPDASTSNTTASVESQPESFTAISITPTCSMTFSAPFVKALRQMKADGESRDVLVNTVVAEFNRQRVILVNAVNRKLEKGEMDFEESQDFFHSRNEPLGKAVAEILGEDCFRHWDEQRLLRSVTTGGYKLTAAESEELYQIEKEHEQRNAELTRMKDNGELDPMDFEAQHSESEEEYQQARKQLVNEEHRGPAANERDSTLAVLKMQTRYLNLTPQQLDELAASMRKYSKAENELMSEPNEPVRDEKARVLQTAIESDYVRILGPQGVAELKKANDYHYQTMKQYQELWRLSDADVNYLYERFAKHDKALEDHRAQLTPTDEQNEEQTEKPDNYLRGLNQELQTDLLRFLGEERYQRFKAAGLIPED